MILLSHVSRIVLTACLAGILCTGCSPSAGKTDLQDENHPMMRRALDRKRANDIDGAIAAFQSALDQAPNLARAHLELGLLFDQNRQDYVRAVYHYQRYLEIRPQAEKRKIVEEMIQYAKYSFAASLPDRPSEAIRMIAQLKEENRGLREEMSRAAQIPEPARTTKAGELDLPDPTGAEEPLVPPFTAPPKTLVVRSGDTLSSIAARVYGDSSQWQAIFEANRVLLVRPGNVRPGQMLVIPVLPQRRSSP